MLGKLLKRRSNSRLEDLSVLKTDLHSHLIPGIDDGAPDMETSITLVRGLMDLGYSKIITTPHITPGIYENSENDIKTGLDKLNSALVNEGIDITLEAAAEYYVDESFLSKINNKKDWLLFAGNQILIETGFSFKPIQLEEVLFSLRTDGITPVLAHPERYLYMHERSLSQYEKLKDQGIKFQLNIGSLTGVYTKTVQKIAYKLIDAGFIDYLGSDLHNARHLSYISQTLSNPYLCKAIKSGNIQNQDL
ncbi:MAG: capsular biosynthesis protein [Chitinophagales bacterium]|nr:capsular biosynthesis protein [Chitinophagales bacterium]